MTTEEATKALKRRASRGNPEGNYSEFSFFAPIQAVNEALEMAITALCIQQEAEKNEPLTLDELREMNGEPVWVIRPDGYVYYNGWALVDVAWKINNVIYLVYTHGSHDHCEAIMKSGGKIYRHKPKEG